MSDRYEALGGSASIGLFLQGFIGYVGGMPVSRLRAIPLMFLDQTTPTLGKMIESGETMATLIPMTESMTDSSGEVMDQMRKVFRDKLSQVPEVEFVYTQHHEGVVCVWSIINQREKSVQKAIYHKEFEILEAIPYVSLDFHVLAREDRPIADIAPFAADLIFTRK